MVHEVVLGILLPLDVIVRDDAIFEFRVIDSVAVFIFIQLLTLITAACEEREEKEDWYSCNNENHVLENVDEQVGIEFASVLHFNV